MAKKVSIHPYKGYLNTEFQLYSHEQVPVEYVVYSKFNDTETLREIKKDVVESNKPHSFRLSIPGSFVVQFSNGTSSEIAVEDAISSEGTNIRSHSSSTNAHGLLSLCTIELTFTTVSPRNLL